MFIICEHPLLKICYVNYNPSYLENYKGYTNKFEIKVDKKKCVTN